MSIDVDLWWIRVGRSGNRASARGAAVRILKAATGTDPVDPVTGEPRWSVGPHGKPGPVAGRHWNLAHGRGWAVLALGDRPVGVDLVHDASLVRPEAVCARYFAPAEAARIGAAHAPLPLIAVALARKEAFAKARGGRLLDVLGTDVTDLPGLFDLPAPPGHTAALAALASDPAEPLTLRQHDWRSTCDSRPPSAPHEAARRPAASTPSSPRPFAASTATGSRSPVSR
ncbi:4'-phosphopantetheinyl transferase family protein [Glycomyces paridis]|uniref:4'-phosphopantetheinyl transferase superfamily protein n=1 Tax=Glycomyces paridis TaxID=2126555 RepID=A0A4S8PKK3_9ACTN|nr:4'-phosphopantetheinyl transferase superfamily protein [Glycomyces paridis]THV30225.1 4'-phosphopantetheinyl transferase superfamily protein [Glycomyces paridis]